MGVYHQTSFCPGCHLEFPYPVSDYHEVNGRECRLSQQTGSDPVGTDFEEEEFREHFTPWSGMETLDGAGVMVTSCRICGVALFHDDRDVAEGFDCLQVHKESHTKEGRNNGTKS